MLHHSQSRRDYALGREASCECSSPLPPLDLVTLSSHCDDDDSSISTTSSDVEDCVIEEIKPRSLFSDYWGKTGGRSRKTMPTPATYCCDESSSAANSYEHCLKIQESPQPSPRTRRRLFANVLLSESLPILSLNNSKDFIRKAKSAPILPNCRPKGSCLRPSRFSGSERRQTAAEDLSSVSFCADVAVLEFEPPCEQFAAKGWSNWFA